MGCSLPLNCFSFHWVLGLKSFWLRFLFQVYWLRLMIKFVLACADNIIFEWTSIVMNLLLLYNILSYCKGKLLICHCWKIKWLSFGAMKWFKCAQCTSEWENLFFVRVQDLKITSCMWADYLLTSQIWEEENEKERENIKPIFS